MTNSPTTTRSPFGDKVGSLAHDALIYDEMSEVVAWAVPFFRAGMTRDERAVAVAPSDTLHALRDSLGDDAHAVVFIDADLWYRHPAQTIAGYHRVVVEARAAGAAGLRVIGEVRFGTTTAEHADWTAYESILNRAFESAAAWVVCPYNRRLLPPAIVADATRTHPNVIDAHGRASSVSYQSPESLLPTLTLASERPPGPPALELRLSRDLAHARRAFGMIARDQGLDDSRIAELTLGFHEIAANALVHARMVATMRCWRLDGQLVCEVEDDGIGLDNPIAGFIPPVVDADGGRGLWLARQMFDRVDVTRNEDGGAVVRMVVAT